MSKSDVFQDNFFILDAIQQNLIEIDVDNLLEKEFKKGSVMGKGAFGEVRGLEDIAIKKIDPYKAIDEIKILNILKKFKPKSTDKKEIKEQKNTLI